MDEAPVEVILRDFNPETDSAMVYATWRNGAFYGAINKSSDDNESCFKALTKCIKQTLKIATVRIACLCDNENIIIGYVVYTGHHLDWIYVKGDFRNKGIAAMLCPKGITTVTDRLTKVGKSIVDKKKLEVKGE